MFLEEDPARWIELDRVDSTQTYLQENKLPPGSVVLAREQSRGRGTGGRPWFARPGRAFIFSGLLARPGSPLPLPMERLSYLPLLVGLAVLETARQILSENLTSSDSDAVDERRLGLKWPNDVLLANERATGKLAGVLIETESEGKDAYRAVIGVGLNWWGLPEQMDESANGRANSEASTAAGVDGAAALFDRDPGLEPRTFAAPFLRRLNLRLTELCQDGPAPLVQAVRRHCWLTGRQVRVDGVIRRVQGIADSGALLVDRQPGPGVEEIYGRRDPLEIVS